MVEGFEIGAQRVTPPGDVFIMAGNRAATLEELVDGIADCIGVRKPSLKLPQKVVWTGCLFLEGGSKLIGKKSPFTRRSLKFYTGNTAFSIEKARKSLGFEPKVELVEGLNRTYHWLLQEGRI
jgi:nucleoside-diphosphate-sugar epimerase